MSNTDKDIREAILKKLKAILPYFQHNRTLVSSKDNFTEICAGRPFDFLQDTLKQITSPTFTFEAVLEDIDSDSQYYVITTISQK